MITQTGDRSWRRGRERLFRAVAGAVVLSLTGCAEVEVGAEAYKSFTHARTSKPPPAARANERHRAPPVPPDPARSQNIDPAMRPDRGAFHAADIALWDGAQTLPGLWISHPMAQTARRVRVTNGETGNQIDAAMFRRDPTLSGPRIVISSEAAELLGFAPGHGIPITIEGLAYRLDDEAAATDAARTEPTPGEAPPAAGLPGSAPKPGPGAPAPTPIGASTQG